MKRYRIYFNREREWPQCWSIDEGDQSTEINVVGFVIRGCAVTSHTHDRKTRVDHDKTPFAWLELAAHLQLDHGVAIFE